MMDQKSTTDVTDLSPRVLLIVITKALGDFKVSLFSSKTLQNSLKNTGKTPKILILTNFRDFFAEYGDIRRLV